jgi:hypothetical protein
MALVLRPALAGEGAALLAGGLITTEVLVLVPASARPGIGGTRCGHLTLFL